LTGHQAGSCKEPSKKPKDSSSARGDCGCLQINGQPLVASRAEACAAHAQGSQSGWQDARTDRASAHGQIGDPIHSQNHPVRKVRIAATKRLKIGTCRRADSGARLKKQWIQKAAFSSTPQRSGASLSARRCDMRFYAGLIAPLNVG
jgi:hypothetical protein